MARRCEASLQKDWSFGFVSWNYVFRSAVNLSRTMYAYERKNGKNTEDVLTAEKLEKGAIQIVNALWGKYQTPSGYQKVNGDLTKVRWVEGLSPAAHRLLQNIEHYSRNLPGTQEARRMMRFETQALRILYGVPVFVTFSPDESHTLLMIRFSRTRTNDPFFKSDRVKAFRPYYSQTLPDLKEDPSSVLLTSSVDDMRESLPPYDVRRKILAGDALASVDGFRVMVLLTFEHLFGLRFCQNCPQCNVGSSPCQDLFGSNATAEGGIFGRIDAVFTSLGAQKSTGSLHAHSQLFVQCLHQHTSLHHIIKLLRKDCGHVVQDYLAYKAHVSRQVYNSSEDILEDQLSKHEAVWPEYKDSTFLVTIPKYLQEASSSSNTLENTCTLSDNIVEGQAWLDTYLHDDVEQLQQMKQHHVHLLNPDTQIREPLAACRRKDNPSLCKADFPRTKWLVTQAVILCAKLLQQMGLRSTGRRCMLGAMHGPMNHPSVNGTHPAMLAVQRCNSDVQLPYRFPIVPASHCCDDEACLQNSDEALVRAAQEAQDAQAGYACDYCTKRQPMAFNEVKECCKGHSNLSQRVRSECVNRIGKRHAMRLMSDAYGKGIVRGQVESMNLRAYHKDSPVTAAESITTCLTARFYGVEYVNLVQRLSDQILPDNVSVLAEVDMRHKVHRKITLRDAAVLYGQRPCDPRVWYLSPYEFVKDWEIVMLSYPQTLRDARHPRHHVRLTPEGQAKLEARHSLNDDP